MLRIPAAADSVEIDRRKIEEVDAAAANLRQKIRVGAELIGREQLDIYPAARGFSDPVQRFLLADVMGCVGS